MASTNLFLIFAFAAAISAVSATEFWVGGPSGWTTNFDYQAWAADKAFRVGDTLVFNYTKGIHNVFKVNATGFQQCIKPDEKLALASGHDVVTLATPGKKWYICGKNNHCADLKQKLVITVDDGAPAPSPDAGAGFVTSPFNVLIAAAVALGIMAFM